MPQLDVFSWGLNFLFCWFFFLILYIYLINFKFFYLDGVLTINSNFSLCSFNSWLW
uniref:ATPase subunit 8 n=1 Tax=Florometra serratissima TaxID=73431 RepID=O63591_9ECHI|nr:ATP synthase F0 subunit 8 [Florometra serratissima]AAD05077.1 ATPase subunit 8 [Florometra serratissima]